MFYMLHEVAELFHICKIQWNIIKKERKATRCSLNICKIQWNIIKKERKKERKKKERKKGK